MSESMIEHGTDCECTRCVGFQPGHELSLTHGARSSALRLTPQIEEIADALRVRMPHYSASFEPAVQAAGIAGARLERAIQALDTAKPGEFAALEQRAGTWWRAWVSALDKLGLTPLAASRMGLNLALAGGTSRAALLALYAPDEPQDGESK